MDDEYYNIAMKIRDAAKKLERGINVIWSICCGFTLVVTLVGVLLKEGAIIVMGVVSMNTLLVTRTVVEVAEDLREEMRRVAEICAER